MIKHNQDGAVSGVGIALVLCIIFLVAAISFGAWAFSSRQNFKNNTDQIVAGKVAVAKQEEASAKEKEFTERDKNPLRTYNGPEAFGSVSVGYPKSWSGYVDDSGGNIPLDGYFYPGVVPSKDAAASTFALRVSVSNQSYAEVLRSLESLQKRPEKTTTITAYALPKLPKVVGVQVTGALPNNKTGIMVVLPLCAQTLKIWTEGDKYVNDFNTYILPNFTFAP
jgi:hypothetical protein